MKNPTKITMTGLIGGKKDEVAFATFDCHDERTKVAFSDDSQNLLVVSQAGKFYQARIPEEPGAKCIQEQEVQSLLGPFSGPKQGQGQGGPN